MMQNTDNRIALRVSGRVQGVGFRWFVLTEAERLGLRGWVRNTADGSVELEAAGPAEALFEFRNRVERGPPAARVARVVELTPAGHDLPTGFEVVR